MEQLVDPAVSKAKFDREVADYRRLDRDFCSRGWFLTKAEFPEVFVAFAAPKLNPAPVILGVLLDFTNYDLSPPSVKMVNPFTRVPYKNGELPTNLPRTVTLETPGGPVAQEQAMLQQPFIEGDLPFLCLPGVREYHENPAHTNNPWLQHRGTICGTLVFILEQISKYGIDPIRGHSYSVALKVTPTGLERGPAPT